MQPDPLRREWAFPLNGQRASFHFKSSEKKRKEKRKIPTTQSLCLLKYLNACPTNPPFKMGSQVLANGDNKVFAISDLIQQPCADLSTADY
ncbi:hypothetical protein AAY473_026498 [Plecturocebus cupreus]